MPYANVIFDIDGTLADSRRDIAGAQIRVLHRLGVDHVREADLYPFIGRRLEETFSRILPAGLLNRIPEAAAMYLEEYLPRALETTTLFPGVTGTLEELRRRGRFLAVASTKRTATVRRVTDHFRITDFFIHLQGSDQLPPKPDPAVVRAVLDARSWNPAATIMVGDTDLDILAGRGAGTATCAVTYGALGADALQVFHPDHLIHSITDILAIV